VIDSLFARVEVLEATLTPRPLSPPHPVSPPPTLRKHPLRHPQRARGKSPFRAHGACLSGARSKLRTPPSVEAGEGCYVTPSRRPGVRGVAQCWSLVRVGFTQIEAFNWGPVLGFTSPREVSRSRLWLVSHRVTTSRSPPKRFEICVEICHSRTYYARECPGPFRPDRIRPPRSRIHVSPLDWEGSGSPCVWARCPAITLPPSEGVAVPAAQGQKGRSEGHERARTTNWDPPIVGPGCCLCQSRRWPPQVAGGLQGTIGPVSPPRGGRGAVSGGLCGWVGQTSRAEGRRVWRPPPGQTSRAPYWKGNPAGAGRRLGGRRGAPASVQGPIKTGQSVATGARWGRRRLPAVTTPPSSPESRPSPLPLAYSLSRPRIPTRTRWPWHPRGRQERRSWRR